jgi:hypothetical protein
MAAAVSVKQDYCHRPIVGIENHSGVPRRHCLDRRIRPVQCERTRGTGLDGVFLARASSRGKAATISFGIDIDAGGGLGHNRLVVVSFVSDQTHISVSCDKDLLAFARRQSLEPFVFLLIKQGNFWSFDFRRLVSSYETRTTTEQRLLACVSRLSCGHACQGLLDVGFFMAVL